MRRSTATTTLVLAGAALVGVGAFWSRPEATQLEAVAVRPLSGESNAPLEVEPSRASSAVAVQTPEDSNGILVRGQAEVRSQDGQVHSDLDGMLLLRAPDDGAEPFVRVPIQKGAWSASLVRGTTYSVFNLSLGQRSVSLASSELNVPMSGHCVLKGEWSHSVLLRVLDKDSHRDLDGISAYVAPRDGSPLPSLRLEQLRPLRLPWNSSPIEVPASEGSQCYLIMAPDHEQKWIALDHEVGGERAVVLGHQVTVDVRVTNVPIWATPIVRIYEAADSSEPSIEAETRCTPESLVRELRMDQGRPGPAPHLDPSRVWSPEGELHLGCGRWIARVEDDRWQIKSGERPFSTSFPVATALHLEWTEPAANLDSATVEGVLLLPPGLRTDNVVLCLYNQPGAEIKHIGRPSEREEIPIAKMTRLESDQGMAFHWVSGSLQFGTWHAVVCPIQYCRQFEVSKAGQFEELAVSAPIDSTVRVVDPANMRPWPMASMEWVPACLGQSADVRLMRVLPTNTNRELAFQAAPGAIRMWCRLRDGTIVEHEAVVGSDAGKIEIPYSESCSVDLCLRDGAAVVPAPPAWWDHVGIKTALGKVEHVQCMSTSNGDGRVASSARYSGLEPGVHVLEIPQLDGFTPAGEARFEVKPGALARVTVHLEREQP